MNWRARNNISADLDIFGSSTAEDAGQVNADFDIFGDEPENKEDISDEDKKTIDNLFGEGNESTESNDVETTDDKSVKKQQMKQQIQLMMVQLLIKPQQRKLKSWHLISKIC